MSLKCRRWQECRAFYEALGLVFEAEEHPGVPEHFSASVGDVVMELHGPAGFGEPSGDGTRIGFDVDDVQAATDAAVAAGGVLHRAPAAGPWGYRAVVLDPDGRRVELMAVHGSASSQEAPPR
ncbi:hypothetical protein GCM10027194_15260 [Thalassiella azotivora]